jgi:hypothetical protein
MTCIYLLFLPPLQSYWIIISVFITNSNVSDKDYIASDGTMYLQYLCSTKVEYRTLRPGTHYPHVTWAHVMLAYSWDVRGDLTLNSMAQIHTSVTVLTSRDLTWSCGRFTCQHAFHISVVAYIPWHVSLTKCERRAGTWADQSSTWDHVT